ncbi:MAG: pyridoxal-phosphate dependent enzyme, partial [Gemmataceae bacterium]|nr:pyridoxal-phosphate dependent enzyme [Gemmataceae bacterium]
TARMILADPVGSRLAHLADPRCPDLDSAYAVEGIGGSVCPRNLDLSLLHGAEAVSDEESFAMARRLLREEGLFVGGSTGTNVAAAMRVARTATGPVVTILCDSWDRYLSKPWLRGLAEPGSIERME